ncbi:MAG: protein kinase [Gammaproteobacteria bacterium]
MSSPSDLTLGRWARLESLFDQAVDMAPDERTKFLNDSCTDDEPLKREVLALLQANDTGGARVQSLITDAATSALGKADSISNRIGPYELIRAIGSGGMGSVHLAERKDAEFNQRVAIKVLHKTMVTPELLARFRSERQILADLNHPNIAHLIDGGTTDEGVPYIVMEYVEGKPINQYCDDNQLTITQRLDLFRQVCAAIEMAHQNLIVHRDIKPNNILVARDGTPKLLDFGIAKSLAELTDSENLTQFGDRLLTPNHASPEQVRGKPVTTASDVYSLGVLLYELLCGVCPFNLNRCTPAQMERIVTELEAEPPSRLLGARPVQKPELGRVVCKEPEAVAIDRGVGIDRLRKQLAGDLDNIALMALHKDRDRRYRSVSRLSEDVQRYLRGLPVAARSDSWGYRAGKFIRRNRWGVATGAAFVFCLIGFSLFAALQANRLAKKNYSLQAAKLYAKDIVLGADPFRTEDGAVPDMLSVLEAAARRLDEPTLPMAPEDVADMEDMLGRVYWHYGRYAESRDYLTRAYRRMEGIRGSDHPDLALTLVALGRLELVDQNLDAARAHLSRALTISERQKGGASEALARSQLYMGNFYRNEGSRDKAEALYRQSISTYDALGGAYLRGKALVLRELGLLLHGGMRQSEAITVTQQALEIDLKEFGPKHSFVAHDYENLGLQYQVLKNYDEAGEWFERALSIHESWATQSDSETVRTKLPKTIRSLAWLRAQQDDFQSAMVLNARSLVLEIENNGLDQLEVGRSFLGLALSMAGQGRLLEAERFYRNAIRSYTADAGTKPTQLAEAYQLYGGLLLDTGRLDDARQSLDTALTKLAGPNYENYWLRGAVLSDLGAVHLAAGTTSDAKLRLEQAIKVLDKSGLPSDHHILARAHARLDSARKRQRESAP